MSYSASDIERLLSNYLKSPEGQKLLKDNKVSTSGYTQDNILKIAEKLKYALIDAFMSATTHADYLAANQYFSGRNVTTKVLKDGTARITFSKHSLFRPSLMGLNGHSTGKGINDIFALITGGTAPSAKRVYGDWMYYNKESKDYGDGGEIVHGRLPRQAKPFVAKIIKECEANNPGITITYPLEWK